MLGKEIEKSLVDKIVQRLKPDFIILFGSYAKGTTHAASDIDLAYFGSKQLSPYERFIFASELAELAGCEVDIVDIAQIDTILTIQIFEQGTPIYISAPNEFTRQRMRAYSMYAELSERRKSMIEMIKRRGSVFGDE